MELQQTTAYRFEPINAGPDWITATARAGREGAMFRHTAEALIDNERAAGREVKPAALRDYRGWRGEGFFCGERAADSLITLSGPRCPPNIASVAEYAHNVSRLDLQVTVWTHGETPHLAVEGLHTLDCSPTKKGRPRSYGMHLRRPHGQTLEIGARVSDSFGRLYDYATAHRQGEARTLWRYEVEFKRRHALCSTRAYLDASDPATYTRNIVHSWYQARGLEPTWANDDSRYSSGLNLVDKKRDVIDWLERSVSKTVAREVKRVGLPRVLTALGIAHMVKPYETEGDDDAT